MLAADAFGVMPPIAKLTPAQAMYHFLSGYTAKVAGTEVGVKDPDMGGQFNNKNAGKRGISLNIRHPKGLQIAKDLVRICDVVGPEREKDRASHKEFCAAMA